MTIVFGCCVGDWGKFDANVRPRMPAGADVCALGGQTSIVKAYNAMIDYCRKHPMTVEALVLLHDDLELIGGYIDDQVRAAVRRQDVTGVIGALHTPDSLAWWNYGLWGKQETDSGPVGEALEIGPVAVVDGSLMILSPWAISSVRFAPAYPGFHGYDVDYCRRVTEAGGMVGVYPIPTHHHSTLGFKSAAIEQSWHEADRIYRDTWGTA